MGKKIIQESNQLIKKTDLENAIIVSNTTWMPAFTFKNAEGSVDAGMRTLFMQEMIRNGVLFQGVFVPCYTHNDMELSFFLNAFEKACNVYKTALKDGYQKYLLGEPAKPVFRKYL